MPAESNGAADVAPAAPVFTHAFIRITLYHKHNFMYLVLQNGKILDFFKFKGLILAQIESICR